MNRMMRWAVARVVAVGLVFVVAPLVLAYASTTP